MSHRESNEPAWVYNKRWGWLVDECPLFERDTGTKGHPHLFLNEMVELAEVGSPYGVEARYYEVACADFHTSSCSHGGLGEWTPLTTAARDLLAALKAEVES